MGKIILLDEFTANKIAAGEVVERPASVVKELIENAIDAKSTRIDVSITDGGLSSITVIDNGIGMDKYDAQTAFERHATSKIKNAEQLNHVLTLGFRGEALPSIASVSRVNLKTKVEGSVSGTEVVIEGGSIVNVEDAACPNGTIIQVNDLFYNTPARKKFMKKPSIEAGHVSNIVNKFAMAYPDISFRLTIDKRLILKTTGNGNMLDCIAVVYGLEIAREMLYIDESANGNRIYGYIGKPSLTRASKSHQTIYINGRHVRNRLISEAVEKAYHSMLMVGRHPVFIISINTSPEHIDVNVHPAKTEIRLSREKDIQEFISNAVAKVLLNNRLIPRQNINKKNADTTKAFDSVQETLELPYSKPKREFTVNSHQYAVNKTATGGSTAETVRDIEIEEIPVKNSGFPQLRPVAQIDNTYIIAQGTDGMYILDQHAAHERVLYEKFMKRPEEYVVEEQLLFPVNIQLTDHESRLVIEHINLFNNLGFIIEHFGGTTFLIRAVPAGMSKDGGKETFLDLLEYFSQNQRTITSKMLKEKLLITRSCKSAIKANQKLSLSEMEALIYQLAETEQPYTCPHGRPTIIHFSSYDLEKKFKRVL